MKKSFSLPAPYGSNCSRSSSIRSSAKPGSTSGPLSPKNKSTFAGTENIPRPQSWPTRSRSSKSSATFLKMGSKRATRKERSTSKSPPLGSSRWPPCGLRFGTMAEEFHPPTWRGSSNPFLPPDHAAPDSASRSLGGWPQGMEEACSSDVPLQGCWQSSCFPWSPSPIQRSSSPAKILADPKPNSSNVLHSLTRRAIEHTPEESILIEDCFFALRILTPRELASRFTAKRR